MATYACSDLHGCLDLYKKIKDFIKPEDKVFFLGDAGDRGLYPWETIKAILNDQQFIFIKGNHEDMLVDALGKGYGKQYSLLRANGGRLTFKECMWEEDWREYKKRIDNLPTIQYYMNEKG
jgi:calcineurin-like phosphoesterase family protein